MGNSRNLRGYASMLDPKRFAFGQGVSRFPDLFQLAGDSGMERNIKVLRGRISLRDCSFVWVSSVNILRTTSHSNVFKAFVFTHDPFGILEWLVKSGRYEKPSEWNSDLPDSRVPRFRRKQASMFGSSGCIGLSRPSLWCCHFWFKGISFPWSIEATWDTSSRDRFWGGPKGGESPGQLGDDGHARRISRPG